MTILLAALLAADAPEERPLAPLAMMPSTHALVPTAPPKPTRAQVLSAVKSEWPRYDVRKAGKLGPLEFSTWVMRANGVTVASSNDRKDRGIRPVPAMNATARAFAVADANHDGGVTPEEMADFLMR